MAKFTHVLLAAFLTQPPEPTRAVYLSVCLLPACLPACLSVASCFFTLSLLLACLSVCVYLLMYLIWLSCFVLAYLRVSDVDVYVYVCCTRERRIVTERGDRKVPGATQPGYFSISGCLKQCCVTHLICSTM